MNLIKHNSTNLGAKILFNLLSELKYSDIRDFQRKNNLTADGLFGMKSFEGLYKKLLKVVDVNFESYYFKSTYQKRQIIWHHSAGWDNARGMFEWWKQDGRVHVATSVGITDNGTVWRGFDEKYFAASIGCSSSVFKAHNIPLKYGKNSMGNWYVSNNLTLDKGAVAVEICNWGNLTEKDGKYYSWANAEVPSSKVVELNYKGYKYFEKYTSAEIKALKYWTLLNAIRFDIPVNYNEDDFWTVNKNALSNVSGVYTHNSYRQDKTDVSPQQNLIKMAKSLGKYMR